MKLLICVQLLSLIDFFETAQILVVYLFPGYSQSLLGNRIFKELLKNGHSVTLLTPYKQEISHRNFQPILVDGVIDKMTEAKTNIYDHVDYSIVERIEWVNTITTEFTEHALNNSNIAQFLLQKNHFDLVIVQYLLTDAYLGFCHHFKAPCVAVSPMSMSSWFNDIIGVPAVPSYSPHPLLKYSCKMTFWQRFHNTFVYTFAKLLQYLRWRPTQEMLLKKYFPGAPSLDDVYRNVSLFLYNGHLCFTDVEPTLPNAIDIAGYHIYPPKALPSDLQILLDNATDGAIYFSMGSVLNSKGFSRLYKAALLKVFSELKQQILWKWEEDLPNGPTNVFTKPWYPQQDVLAHPNVVLFITHGGAMSSIEAIYYGKPLLGLPIFSDQGSNSAKSQQAGYGKFIPFEELTEENFREQLNELLNNPVYAENAKTRSRIMRDQPLSPMEKAMYWIEYVLRHKGAPHLKPASLKLTWYQYFLVDVTLGFVIYFVNILIVMTFVFKGIWFLYLSNSKRIHRRLKQS